MAEGEEGEKTTVLVRLETPSGERNRPVSFFGGKRELRAATLETFSDLLSGEANLYFQLQDQSWGDGVFVDLQEQAISPRSIVRAVDTKISVTESLKGAHSLCTKLGKPTEEHARRLSSLFPSSSVGKSSSFSSVSVTSPSTTLPSSSAVTPLAKPSTFDPTDKPINFDLKLKKKCFKRSRAFKLWVVVGENKFTSVPKSHQRKELNKKGRVKKIEFRRCMCDSQVKSRITMTFPSLRLDKPIFMKCVDHKMVVVNLVDDYPSGSVLHDIASKESLYMVENEDVLHKASYQGFYTEPDEVGDEDVLHKPDLFIDLSSGSSETDTEGKNRSKKIRALIQKADKAVVKLQKKTSKHQEISDSDIESSGQTLLYKETPKCQEISDSDIESSGQTLLYKETPKQRHSIMQQQDKAYFESLEIDRKKSELARLLHRVQSALEQKSFGQGILVAFRFSFGKVQRKMDTNSSVKDLYQLAMTCGGLEEPFTIFTLMPRSPIPLSDLPLHTYDIKGKMLIVEIDTQQDSIKFFELLYDELTLEKKTVVAEISPEQVLEDSTEPTKQLPEVGALLSDDACVPVKSSSADWNEVIVQATDSRENFVNYEFHEKTTCNTPHDVNRATVFQDFLDLYSNHPDLVFQFPLKISFVGEDAVDLGGVARDCFSAFWEQAYTSIFDGSALLSPSSHVSPSKFLHLGKILSHGYLSCGFLPCRIAFPVLASVVLGPSVNIPKAIMIQSFLDYLSNVDREIVVQALNMKEFTCETKLSLTNILSRFHCRDLPTPQNIKPVLLQLSEQLFLSQPFAAISRMNHDIPCRHNKFWSAIEVEQLYDVYTAVNASPSKVLRKLVEPAFFANSHEQRVYTYLEQYIGGMSVPEVRQFLRYVTGSTVLTDSNLFVQFNALSGAARRPIGHTCGSTLELPYSYVTYADFVQEFTLILANMENWAMDAL